MNTDKTNVIKSREGESTKMDTTTTFKPQTFAELLPSHEGIIPKDEIHKSSPKKLPTQTMVQSSTSVTPCKPLTNIAEMMGECSGTAASRSAAPEKKWKSSGIIDKKIRHTANEQMKNNPLRKVLNFEAKPKAIHISSPELQKNKNKAKTSLIPRPEKVKFTQRTVVIDKKIPLVPDTPLSNLSCDKSFLQKKKDINDIAEKVNALVEKINALVAQSLENIAEMSPPVSIPFKDYRNVTEFSSNLLHVDNLNALNDNTIMCFEKQSFGKEIGRRDESVIVCPYDMYKKVTSKTSTHIDELLEVEKRTVNNLQKIENTKQDHLRTLKYIRNLIQEQKQQTTSMND